MKNSFVVKNLLLILLLITGAEIYSQAYKPKVPDPERVRTYDVQHIRINVSFDWTEKEVTGNVETRIVPLSDNFNEFEVEAVDFKINNVRDQKNSDIKYDYDGKKIKVMLDKNYTAADTIIYSVDYVCKPQKGLYFIYPTELNPSMPYQIWTQGEENDNRYWIPLYDYPNDKTTFEIYATIDTKFKTLSNGYLDYSRKIQDTDLKQDHWVMDKPNSTYLIMFGAGDFQIISDTVNGIPVSSYVDQNISLEDAANTFRNTPQMLKEFSEKFDNYPWNKYSQVVVEDFIFGGMENTTATVLIKPAVYPKDNANNLSSDPLISHELAHQWWGDLITCRNWSEKWINESFAEFSSVLWKEIYSGKDEYDYEIIRDGDNAIRTQGIIGKYPIWAGYGDVTANLYDKGAVVLNSFRHILGEDFFPALRTFLKDNAYDVVETKDFTEAVNKSYNQRHGSNKDFSWMVEQWIMKASYPEFEVKYEYDENAKQLILNVKQVQVPDTITPVFRMPMDVRIKNRTEDKTESIEIKEAEGTYRIDLRSKPVMVVFDPGNKYLKKIYFDKPFDDWKAQLTESEDAIDRITALRGLEKFLKPDTTSTAGKPAITINETETLRLFDDVINNDKFWGVRAEVCRILGNNFILDRTSTVLKNSYDKQTDNRIKREIFKALGKSTRTEDADLIKEKIQNETNDYIFRDGLEALVKLTPKEKIYETVIPYAGRNAHRNVIQGVVVNALGKASDSTKNPHIKKALMDFAFGTDIEGRLRASAINALRNYADDEDVKVLAMKNIDYNFSVVRRALVNLLSYSKDRSVLAFLQNRIPGITDNDMVTLLKSSIKRIENTN